MTSSGIKTARSMFWIIASAAGAMLIVFQSAFAADPGILTEQATGKAIYEARCSTCHGPNGEGTKGYQIPATAPPLRGDPFVQYGSVAAIVQVIRHGRTGAKRHYDDTYADMPSFDATMIDDLRPLIAFLKGDLQKGAAPGGGSQ